MLVMSIYGVIIFAVNFYDHARIQSLYETCAGCDFKDLLPDEYKHKLCDALNSWIELQSVTDGSVLESHIKQYNLGKAVEMTPCKFKNVKSDGHPANYIFYTNTFNKRSCSQQLKVRIVYGLLCNS